VRRSWALVIGTIVASAVVAYFAIKATSPRAPVIPVPTYEPYTAQIQPLFDRRCVACHACFDAPCQLNLQSFDGADRGANKTIVYRPERITSIPPTRMFQDARTTAEWRTKFDFFPVVDHKQGQANVDTSILYHLVQQRRREAKATPLDASTHHVCPRTNVELDGMLRAEPEVGMPFGFPPLSDDETARLADWVRSGAGAPMPIATSTIAQSEVSKWESFLDADDVKTRTFARYIYEHLFFAHVQFGAAPGEWFRLVRSRTAAPAPIDEIATVRPYDDPQVAYVHYRFRRLTETLVVKTHIPYRLDDAKLARLRALFVDSSWGDKKIEAPSYAPEVATNPFIAFQSIPARSRYQFLLDDAHYHVKTFIHGPVCKGAVALDVIDEQFLIFFLAPESDPSVTDASFLPRVSSYLAIPAQGGDGIEAFYERFRLRELEYLKARAAMRRDAPVPGRALTDLWNGNLDSVLTVYRHFDNAYVLRGPIGGVPKTAWVMDYPIFERMYYDLVAGFDVFGNVVHQIATRRYMNLLRIEAEDELLMFVPGAQRKRIRDEWYRGHGVAQLVDVADPFFGGPEPAIRYDDPAQAKEELVRKAVAQYRGDHEPIQWNDVAIEGDDSRARFERSARAIVNRPAPFVRVLPDAALLRVRVPTGDDLVYTLVRNRAHKNIDFMFLENEFLEPEKDTLNIVRGVAVSRPNMFFTVATNDVSKFIGDFAALAPDDGSYRHFIERFAIRRGDPRFWETSDFFNDAFVKAAPDEAGIIDLTRYAND